MANVLIVAYLLIVLALIAVILLQRSEGGALGIGGGNSFMSARGSANLLTRTTAILATLFFATAIGLTILSELDRGTSSILERAGTGTEDGAAPSSVLDALNSMSPSGSDADLAVPAAPEAPANDAPAAPAEQAPAAAPGADAPAAPAEPAPANSNMAPSTTTAPAAPAAPATTN